MIRLLNLGPAKHEKAAIYAVNQRILNVLELRELLCGGAIRRHQLGAKDLLTPTSYDSVIETHGRYAVFPTLQNRLHF